MKYKAELLDIEAVKPNPSNPRHIKQDKHALLVKSIKDFPQMLELRPLVIDKKGVVIGGNMRLSAAKEAGLKKIPVLRAENLTPAQVKEFIIKDNVGFGEWDWDALANEWDAGELADWGLDFPGAQDFSDKNKEIDTDGFADEVTITLKYSEADHAKVREALSKTAATPEQAVWKLLKLA